MATLVSVDITLVDYLWERYPVGMPSVVEEVQKTVRECIVHWRAYEVKTVRERTLIACKSSEQAIHMAIDIQQRLRRKSWDKHIDTFYNEVELDLVQRRELSAGHSSCDLEERKYKELWSGPRIVIGMDSGMVNPEPNWYDKGSYNYVGEVTEKACAAEHVAGWGEILLTANTFHQTNLNKIDPIQIECIGKVRLIKDQVSDLMYRVEAIPGRPPYTFEEREALRRCDNPLHEPGSSYYDPRSRKELTPTASGGSRGSPPKQVEPLVANEVQDNPVAREEVVEEDPPPPPPPPQEEEVTVEPAKEVVERSAVIDPTPVTEDVVYVPVKHEEYAPPPTRHPVASPVLPVEERTSPLVTTTYQPTYRPSPPPPVEVKPSRKPGPSPPPPVFWNGKPSVPFQHAYRCFQEGNGLLFRVVDENTGTWSFYNDTIHYTMTATIEIGRKSVFTTLDGAQIPYNAKTKQYEGQVVVPPLTTKRVLQGKIKGFNLAYTADAE